MALEEVVVTNGIVFDPLTFRQQDLIRSCRYAAMFPNLPSFLSGYDYATRKFSYLTESIEFPGKSVNTIDYRIAGTQKIKVPTFKDFNEVTFTMYYPSDFPMYGFFSEWIDGISPTSTTNKYFDEIIASNITLYQYSDNSVSQSRNSYSTPLEKVLKVDLHNAYPLNYASMPCTWADDGFQRISVTFFYEFASWMYKNPPIDDGRQTENTSFSQDFVQSAKSSDEYSYLSAAGAFNNI